MYYHAVFFEQNYAVTTVRAVQIHAYTSIIKIIQAIYLPSGYIQANILALGKEKKDFFTKTTYTLVDRKSLVVNAKNNLPCYFMSVICFDAHTSPKF